MRYLIIALILSACEEIPTTSEEKSEGIPAIAGMEEIIIGQDGEEIGYVYEVLENAIVVYRPWPNDFYAVVDADTGEFSFPNEVYFSDADCNGSAFVEKWYGPNLRAHVHANGNNYVVIGGVIGAHDTRSYFMDGYCTNTSLTAINGSIGELIQTEWSKDLSEDAPLKIK